MKYRHFLLITLSLNTYGNETHKLKGMPPKYMAYFNSLPNLNPHIKKQSFWLWEHEETESDPGDTILSCLRESKSDEKEPDNLISDVEKCMTSKGWEKKYYENN